MLKLEYPAHLPISQRAADIREALKQHQVVVVAGATGSGKTTQLPKLALEVAPPGSLIGVTQPRRIAATSVAARVAEELGCPLGREVGYQIRFEDKTSRETRIKFMTDGILLAELASDPLFRRYQTLIIDEAHERSLNVDFLLGCLQTAVKRRPDLRVVVSSATIETGRFSAFFSQAPVIEVEGRTFPVEVLYEPPDPELDLAEAVAQSVASISELDSQGDILVFLPGEREIRDTERELEGRRLRHTQILPLYSRLSASEQNRVFALGGQRRVILATNVAETSLTLPGIVYVVDAGIARLARYDARTGTTRLKVEPISRASADQRKGRCGRVRDGICVRLYSEENYEGRPAFTDPEVLRVGLSSVILRMKAGRIGDVEEFPFIDPPRAKSIAEGYRTLEELGAINEEHELTELGRRLARFPLDPRVARMIVAGAEFGCLEPILVLAAALEIQDPRERPRAAEAKADGFHRRFRVADSDFAGLLKLWDYVSEVQSKSTSQLKRVCRDEFLSFTRVREWREIHRQLCDAVKEQGLAEPRRGPVAAPEAKREPTAKPDRTAKPQPSAKAPAASPTRQKQAVAPASAAQKKPAASGIDVSLHRALLTGLLSRIGLYQPEHRSYFGAKQTRFTIHPSSSLAKNPPPWIVAFELVETSQLFARVVAKFEPEWLDGIADHLLKRSYSEPTWSEKSARASVREHATLFGLSVFKDRSVDYATLAPGRARLIFIEHALVRGEYTSSGEFEQHNRGVMLAAEELRGKARRSDMLADDEGLLDFFGRRVPSEVVNGKTFEEWRKRAERRDARVLFLSLTDVLANEPELDPASYPSSLAISGATLELSYKFEPAEENDGVTVLVPLGALGRLNAAEFEWTIPAWHTERISQLLETLPKPQRMTLEPLDETARVLAGKLRAFEGPGLEQLASAAGALARIPLRAQDFRADKLPRYLSFGFRVIGPEGRLLGESRDLAALQDQFASEVSSARGQLTASAGSSGRHTSWTFSDVPSQVQRRHHGREIAVFPALKDWGNAVEQVLHETAEAAESEHRKGVRRLLVLQETVTLSGVAARLPGSFRVRTGAPTSGEQARFRDQVLCRIVEEVFLPSDARLPRKRAEFEALLKQGSPHLPAAAGRVLQLLSEVARELLLTKEKLEQAERQPSATKALREIQTHLGELFPEDLLEQLELGRLAHYGRYLKGIQVRLQRALHDPKKDAEKTASFARLWLPFLEKRAAARNASQAWALRWALEEFRLVTFAPELKTAFPVNLEMLERAVSGL